MGQLLSILCTDSTPYRNHTTNIKMPKGSGLTKPMKLSAELADIVGKKEASRAECIKELWLILRRTTCKIPPTNNTSPPTRRWLRFSVATASVLSAWPSSSPSLVLSDQLKDLEPEITPKWDQMM